MRACDRRTLGAETTVVNRAHTGNKFAFEQVKNLRIQTVRRTVNGS